MRRLYLTTVGLALIFCFSAQLVRSQQTRVAEREAEWNNYALPHTLFVRREDANKVVLFQVPVEWKQQPAEHLTFIGPNGASLTVFLQPIPDGYPLRDYVSALLQPLRNVTDDVDSLIVRRTTMAGLEGREIVFESDADTTEMTRRIMWSAVSGPNALTMVLMTPAAKAREVEPYFKAIVQSVIFLDKSNYAAFEPLRTKMTKDPEPASVDEVQTLAAALTGLDGSSRQTNISKLAARFASAPDTAIDLSLDGRPMVRAAAYEAIAHSRNNSLDDFLLRALDDREPFAAEQAARAIAAKPNVIELLRRSSLEWFAITPLGRVWPFLSRSNQVKILEEIFAQTLLPAANSTTKNKSAAGKPNMSVRTIPAPAAQAPAIVHQLHDPNRQVHGLALVEDLPASDFKMPLAKILAAKNDSLTTLALQIAWRREELLPVDELFKLLTWDNNEVRRLAMLHLGQSATAADLKRLEAYLSTPPTAVEPVRADPAKKTAEPSPTVAQTEHAISRIRFREELSTANGGARQQLIKKGLADPKLAEWVWYRFVRIPFNHRHQASQTSSVIRPLKVLPLGENIFPRDVTYYAALPEPERALDKFSSALDGLQLESARSQASLVLILNVFREQLAHKLDAPSDASPISYSGINLKEPIALARWSADGAPGGIESAQRRALIMRVTDRARFERSLSLYQGSIGNFSGLPDAVSVGARFLTVLPAFLPLGAKALLEGSIKPAEAPPLLSYEFVSGKEWNGYPIKIVERRRVADSGHLTSDAAYLTYLGDTAVLAANLESLADVIQRAASAQPTLATNPDFKRITEAPGEVIYLSNFMQLIADAGSQNKEVATEIGALKLSNSAWENIYQIQFPQRDWLKPFIVFQPEELASPRDLLPRSTIAYYFMNFDAAAGWRDWAPHLFDVETRKELSSLWSLDFEKDVLAELGPECGVALLGLPTLQSADWDLSWVAFFKLKSDRLARALELGKLLSGAPASTEPTQVKLKSGNLFVRSKNGFLILASRRQTIDALDQKEKLAASRDFSRAAKRAPSGVVAFGGYNLEAAIADIGKTTDDPIKTMRSSLLSSVANAFHTPHFYATASSGGIEGRFSLSMDREGRFSVSELSSLAKDFQITYAVVDVRGVPIQNQERLSSLKLRIRATAAGEIDRIKEDVSSAYQIVEKSSDNELELRILARHSEPKTSVSLPVKGAEFARYLQPDNEIRSDDKSVVEKARSVVGEERDGWKVARKLADWTYTNIKWKRVDFATAPQTLATLEADCLEFSQLYVAMARSLGLPARIVSGMAYSGSSFGGHAWVEVYVGEWIEVDPTWGTAFVDATHIRNSLSGALLTYASLNLLDLEVLEALPGIADYQKDPRLLAQKLSEELPDGSTVALSSALDLTVLVNEYPDLGNWESLSDSERNLLWSAYRRLLADISAGYRKASPQTGGLQLLKVSESGDKAEAVLIRRGLDDLLLKLILTQRNGAWFLTELVQPDSYLHIISETIQPTIKTILGRRSNKSARAQTSEFVRVLLTMEKDSKGALVIVDRALQSDPKNHGLRHLRALLLLNNERKDEAIQVWKELAGEARPFPLALLNLAYQFEHSEEAEHKKQAVGFYTRYGELEPDDPRTHVALARLYESMSDDTRAEAEHRAAVDSDPTNPTAAIDLAAFLAERNRFKEAVAVIDEAEKKTPAEQELFADLLIQLFWHDDKTILEQLALSQPQKMEKSARASLYLAYRRLEERKSLQALSLLKRAALLQKDLSEVQVAMARAYRQLRNWTAALTAAEAAIRINVDESEGYFNKACALSRLGRVKEALQSLQKAVELDPDLSEDLADEADLKPLAGNPAFKKLISP